MKRVVASYCSSSDMLATLLLSLYVFWEMAEVRSFVLARNLPLRDLTPFRFSVEEPLLGLGGVWFVRRHFIIPTVLF